MNSARDRAAFVLGPIHIMSGLAALLLASLPASAHADMLAELEAPLRSALQSGSWLSVLALSFAAGVATSLTRACIR